MLVDADKAKEKLAMLCDELCCSTDEGAAAIRAADLSDCAVDDDAMTKMCDAYADENQRLSDQVAELTRQRDGERLAAETVHSIYLSTIARLVELENKSPE